MNIVFTEWDKALVLLIFFVFIFIFSFLSRITIFNELDYYEIKYTQKTKKKDAMANIFQSLLCSTMVAYFTTIAFTTATLVSPPLMAANLDLATINFGIKIEKIYEKVKRSIDKGETNKLIGYMYDFKHEVEQYTGTKIDINKQIDQAQKEARARGQKIDDKYIKQIKKRL